MAPSSAHLVLAAVTLASAATARARDANEQPGVDAPLAAVVAAERAFAADSVARGIRASFLSAFAEDGINFSPHPEHTRAELLKEPEPKTTAARELDWKPVWADVSSAGDLGYTTGPYVLRDLGPTPRPARHGYYFSIWKKQEDGSWKVAVDAGIRTPEPAGEAAEYRSAPQPVPPVAPPSLDARAAADALRAREAELGAALRSRGGEALADFAAPEARLHRDGVFPSLGRAALRSALAATPALEGIEVLDACVAASFDLGYAWGKTSFVDGTSGYFVRVWRRGDDGVFRVTLDWANSVPKAKTP